MATFAAAPLVPAPLPRLGWGLTHDDFRSRALRPKPRRCQANPNWLARPSCGNSTPSCAQGQTKTNIYIYIYIYTTPRIRSGIGPKTPVSFGRGQSGPSPVTLWGRAVKNKIKKIVARTARDRLDICFKPGTTASRSHGPGP